MFVMYTYNKTCEALLTPGWKATLNIQMKKKLKNVRLGKTADGKLDMDVVRHEFQDVSKISRQIRNVASLRIRVIFHPGPTNSY